MTNKKMSDLAVTNAKKVFAQGVEDETNGVASTRRLQVKEQYRVFYDAARKQVAEQLAPAREAQRLEDEANGVEKEKEWKHFDETEKARKLNAAYAARRRQEATEYHDLGGK